MSAALWHYGCPAPPWWTSLLGFHTFLQSRGESLSVAPNQFGGEVYRFSATFASVGLNRCQLTYFSLVDTSLGFLRVLQFAVESLSVALYQFGGLVSWVSATCALQG